MGVPVLTLRAAPLRSAWRRASWSTAGPPDLICGDVQAYVQQAVALGRDVLPPGRP